MTGTWISINNKLPDLVYQIDDGLYSSGFVGVICSDPDNYDTDYGCIYIRELRSLNGVVRWYDSSDRGYIDIEDSKIKFWCYIPPLKNIWMLTPNHPENIHGKNYKGDLVPNTITP